MNRPLPLARLTLKPSVSQRLSPEALIVLHAIHYDWAPEDVREHKDVCLLQACSGLRRTKRESFLFKSLTTTPWAPAVNTTQPASDTLSRCKRVSSKTSLSAEAALGSSTAVCAGVPDSHPGPPGAASHRRACCHLPSVSPTEERPQGLGEDGLPVLHTDRQRRSLTTPRATLRRL